jgi:hypothetical protein
VQFNKWAKEYGPIFSLIVGTQTFIVLSSDVVVKELLDKRGAIYSDRMDAYLAKLCSEDHHMLTMVMSKTGSGTYHGLTVFTGLWTSMANGS